MDYKLIFAKALKRLLHPAALRGCCIHSTSKVCSKSELTAVNLDRYSYIGNDCFMVNVDIGSFCSIADRVVIGGAHHPIERVSSSPVFHEGKNILGVNFKSFSKPNTKKTIIMNDVWIGIGTVIKSGVSIAHGAVVGMGSVVTKDIGPYEIWAGNPAKLIRKRFSDELISELLKVQWWDWADDKIIKYSTYFISPDELIKEYNREVK